MGLAGIALREDHSESGDDECPDDPAVPALLTLGVLENRLVELELRAVGYHDLGGATEWTSEVVVIDRHNST